AFGNLMTNAARFTNPHGTIDIKVSREHGNCVIRINDTGVGIPGTELSRLGERFFRSSVSQRASLDGTGLGFVVAKTIVEHHDGDVDVQSSTAGTQVKVLLPSITVDQRLSA